MPSQTKTDNIKRVLRVDGALKAMITEHVRGMIRTYGLKGLKSDGSEDFQYELIHTDPVTSPHFRHLRRLWKHRDRAEAPYREFNAAWRDFISDCHNKVRDSFRALNLQYPPPAKLSPPDRKKACSKPKPIEDSESSEESADSEEESSATSSKRQKTKPSDDPHGLMLRVCIIDPDAIRPHGGSGDSNDRQFKP